ncbi:MAG: Na-K-Cl cotransporter [bacterium]|nr:Na-K-Cl cotransporter [bacterium]
MDNKKESADTVPKGPHKFGTFLGVFTPSVLTILGVIMYLRFGWMVGSVGIWTSLIIVTLATSITFVTSLSVSAVATNMQVGVGGEYFLISRSLGLELGGAIGVPLYLARAVSVTLYAFGLAESLKFVWPDVPIQWVAAGIIVFITLVAAKSAALTLKIQLPLMGAVFISILVMAIGVFKNPSPLITTGAPEPGISFWIVFAVFFPAVTGFTAGVGLSGDLKDPSKSIPLGSIGAVVCGYVVYMGITVILGFAAPAGELVGDSLIWQKVAIVPFLILPGMWGAILSSAIGSILAGPRVLQALASDGIAPAKLGKISPKSGEPMTAIWVTCGIALLAVLVGDLNSIAPVVTMFFLTFYTSINLVAGLEILIGDPSYRPRIRVPWFISFAAAGGSIAVMFLINKVACIVAVALELGVYFWLRRKALKATFGDLRSGLLHSLIKGSLEQLKNLPPKARSWRPFILLFAGDVKKRADLVRFATWLNQKRGLVTVCHLFKGNLETFDKDLRAIAAENDSFLLDKGLRTFPEVILAPNFDEGVEMTVQANGLAGLASNTVMFGWSDKPERLAQFFRIMRRIGKLGKSMIISKINEVPEYRRNRQIDIWWRGKESNGDMLLLMAHLLSLNVEWQGGKINIKSIAKDEEEKLETEAGLARMIPEIRIKAETEVFVLKEGQKVSELIKQKSMDAEVVFMGLAEPAVGEEEAYAQRMLNLVADLPGVVLVKNSSFFAGKLV